MDWVEGLKLNEYINKNINNPYQLLKLANDFKTLMAYFHKNNLSHGDLHN